MGNQNLSTSGMIPCTEFNQTISSTSKVKYHGHTTFFVEIFARTNSRAFKHRNSICTKLRENWYGSLEALRQVRENLNARKLSNTLCEKVVVANDLREIARKLVPNFESFVEGAQKICPRENFYE